MRKLHAGIVLLTLSGLCAMKASADDEESESYFEAEQGDTGREPQEESEEDEKAREAKHAEAVRGAVPELMRGVGVYGGFILGVGGEVDVDGGGDDLEATLGFVTGLDYLLTNLTPYAAIGGELRLGAFKTDYADTRGYDRSWYIDLAIKPRGRYAFNDQIEGYLTLPFGLSYFVISDDWSAEGGPGFTLGVGPGGTYMITDLFGVNLEALYLWHWVEIESSVTGGPVEQNTRLAQLTFFASVMMKL